MKADFVIRGGRVIDPAAGVDEVKNIYISGARIFEPGPDDETSGAQVIDASGMIVCPGLIDFHAHLFYSGSDISIHPDLLPAQGTTAAVDAGSAGCANYEAFSGGVCAQSLIRMKNFMNLYPGGQTSAAVLEDYRPELCRTDALARVIDRHRDEILGLKIRFSRGIIPENAGTDPLKFCVETAEKLEQMLGKHLRVCVHMTDSPVDSGEAADCLRPGDIFCHCYQGAGNPIVRPDGAIAEGVLRARARGVLFDAANGRANFCFETAKNALAAGFLPDIISSDLTVFTFLKPPHVGSLPAVLSKYLALGMQLPEVLRCCTAVPAEIMGLEGEAGTLAPGAAADIAVFSLEDRKWTQADSRGDTLECGKRLVPQMTMRAGKVLYCREEFYL